MGIQIFTGNANPILAASVAYKLSIELSNATVSRFCDGELEVSIKSHVRGDDAYIIQPTCTPTNDNLMELLFMSDALRRSDVGRITAVVPYYGYARQDRRPDYNRTPISSRLVADMMVAAGINKVITIDIHSEQQQGFFPNTVPMINTSATPEIVADIWKKFKPELLNGNVTIVSPDVGGVPRARKVAGRVNNASMAIIDKRRQKANESEVMNLIGDVDGQHCVIVDDMVDTAGTLCKAAAALKLNGALSVTAYGTHAVLSGPAYQNIMNSQLDELVITDTIPIETDSIAQMLLYSGKIRVVSIAALLAETMKRASHDESVSEIYKL